jgi:5-methylcytosine-specific restriction endonuclease McrA
MMTNFADVHPSLDNYWRAIILFGRNVASYKFALGKTLLELTRQGKHFVPLTELARPFARHIAEHLKQADKQATSRSSQFLEGCRKFNRGELSEEALADMTVRMGFNNVIDAFHVVGNGELGVRFFADERATPGNGIRLTDEAFRLTELYQHRNLPFEVEARWRLVETAWELNLPTSAFVVCYDGETECLVADSRLARRKAVARCRNALNGYQKGKCFYCFGNVSLVEGAEDLADVDHVFPHRLKPFKVADPVDGVWNLVLACQTCNREEKGKFDRLPELRYLERLHRRNEFLIESHHPLCETLMLQTGATEQARRTFLNSAYYDAVRLLVQRWVPVHEYEPAF